VKVLGILNIILGAFGLLGALVILVVFGGAAGILGAASHGDPDARIAIPIISIVGVGLFFLILLLSIPDIIAGIGLLQFKPWARILGIILSVLHLIHIPFGTAVGIYGLWVLLSGGTEQLFQSRTAPPQPVTPVKL
jgi:hypothetical protein